MNEFIVEKVDEHLLNLNIDIFVSKMRDILFLEKNYNIDVLLKQLIPNIDNEDILVFKNELKSTIKIIKKDLEVYLECDPATSSIEEVIICYPGFFAIWVYRIAHIFIKLDQTLVARLLTEYAHSKTGIDIHPKVTIGEGFFIDHGTGVVIGETTSIGKNVKIYHGVTLGALSLDKIDEVRGKKRHPTIGDNVTIYANATILGGNVKIGDNSIIGSNVFLTKSIKENSKVKNVIDNVIK